MLLSSPPLLPSSSVILVDGDIIAYRAAFYAEKLEGLDAILKVDQVVDFIAKKCNSHPENMLTFLTGAGNFRHEEATTVPYKGNRSKKEPPRWLHYSREYLIDNYCAVVSSGEEADDLIGINATLLGEDTVVASIDKDMLQIPCYHYNFKRDEWHQVSHAEGLMFFYEQILTGDRADNIIGIKGIGPVKAKKILQDCETEEDLWQAVVDAYDGDIDRVLENARLLWLRRKEGELWDHPHQRNEPEQLKLDIDPD